MRYVCLCCGVYTRKYIGWYMQWTEEKNNFVHLFIYIHLQLHQIIHRNKTPQMTIMHDCVLCIFHRFASMHSYMKQSNENELPQLG